MNRLLGREVYFIHLVRDPRDVILSKLKGDNNLLAKGDTRSERGASVIGLIGWIMGNWYALRTTSKLGPDRAFILRYEQFLNDPETALSELGKFLGADLSGELQTILTGRPFPAGHIVAGNRMSNQKEIVLRRKTANRDALKFRHKLMCRIFARPMDLYIEKKLKEQAERLQRSSK